MKFKILIGIGALLISSHASFGAKWEFDISATPPHSKKTPEFGSTSLNVIYCIFENKSGHDAWLLSPENSSGIGAYSVLVTSDDGKEISVPLRPKEKAGPMGRLAPLVFQFVEDGNVGVIQIGLNQKQWSTEKIPEGEIMIKIVYNPNTEIVKFSSKFETDKEMLKSPVPVLESKQIRVKWRKLN